jgi:hypothetical protein
MVHQVDTELGDLLAAIDNNTNAPGLKERTAFFVSSGGLFCRMSVPSLAWYLPNDLIGVL